MDSVIESPCFTKMRMKNREKKQRKPIREQNKNKKEYQWSPSWTLLVCGEK